MLRLRAQNDKRVVGTNLTRSRSRCAEPVEGSRSRAHGHRTIGDPHVSSRAQSTVLSSTSHGAPMVSPTPGSVRTTLTTPRHPRKLAFLAFLAHVPDTPGMGIPTVRAAEEPPHSGRPPCRATPLAYLRK